jgi:O-methyltransferase
MNHSSARTDELYLDLLKKTLTGFVFRESADRVITPDPGWSPRAMVKRAIVKFAAARGIRLTKIGRFVPEAREEGADWPSLAYTMVGLKRLNNVQMAVETVIREKIPGDLCECGVWRGGTAMFMRAVLNYYGELGRLVWAADSFAGLPKPDAIRYPADRGDPDFSDVQYLSVPLELVKQNFELFGLIDNVRFLKGWFKDSLPNAPIKELAVLRADGDLYESTMDILQNLYHKVSPGGFVIIDDFYSWETCQRAVMDFRTSHQITAPIEAIDSQSAYWRVP